MESIETEASLIGQAEIWQHMFAYVDSFALNCAIELQIPDIIHSLGAPITLSQIASSINSPSVPEISYLERIMRLLVRNKIFTADHPSDGGETLYGLTHSSKWLVTDSEYGLRPLFLLVNHSQTTGSWHSLSKSVKEGGIAFEKTYGRSMWDVASQDEKFNRIFNDAMAYSSKSVARAIVTSYKDGFDCLKSLVDVGGGIGGMISGIVKSYPHIKGINFDLPHVIATAPPYDGVSHVGGDMLQAVLPNADAVLLKWVLHNWSDEACLRILKNCRKTIPEKTGKVIIVDMVLQPDGKGLFDVYGLRFDLVMMVNTSGGKERNELQWKKILEDGGFPRYKLIKLPVLGLQFIIEAYLE